MEKDAFWIVKGKEIDSNVVLAVKETSNAPMSIEITEENLIQGSQVPVMQLWIKMEGGLIWPTLPGEFTLQTLKFRGVILSLTAEQDIELTCKFLLIIEFCGCF